jgi:hypothetical protein
MVFPAGGTGSVRRLFEQATGSRDGFQRGRHAQLRPRDASRLLPAFALAAALTLALAATTPATSAGEATKSASEVTKIFEECSNGTLPTGFSQQAYSQAIKQMEAELAEYTDCPDLIHKAELAGAASTHGASTSSGPREAGTPAVAPPTQAEQHTLESIPHASAPPVNVGSEVIHPGVVRVNLASAVNTLPSPLLALLAFLLVCALVAITWAVRRRMGRAGGHSISGD